MQLPRNANEVLLLLNPACSKCRTLRQLLAERAIPFRERDYLLEPLERAELDDLGQRLCRPPHEWMRRDEAAWSTLGLSESSAPEELLEALARHPELLQRPILVRGDLAAVGRPPEHALDLVAGLGAAPLAEPEQGEACSGPECASC